MTWNWCDTYWNISSLPLSDLKIPIQKKWTDEKGIFYRIKNDFLPVVYQLPSFLISFKGPTVVSREQICGNFFFSPSRNRVKVLVFEHTTRGDSTDEASQPSSEKFPSDQSTRAARECIFRDYLRFIYPDQVVCRLQSDSVALIPKFRRGRSSFVCTINTTRHREVWPKETDANSDVQILAPRCKCAYSRQRCRRRRRAPGVLSPVCFDPPRSWPFPFERREPPGQTKRGARFIYARTNP